MRKEEFLKVLDEAIACDKSFVVVKIELPDHSEPEFIINTRLNFEMKKDYYEKMYDLDMEHKHAQGLRILSVKSSNHISGIIEDIIESGRKKVYGKYLN